jgi:hypothetical protein
MKRLVKRPTGRPYLLSAARAGGRCMLPTRPPAWSLARRSESIARSGYPAAYVTSPRASFEARDIATRHPLTTCPFVGPFASRWRSPERQLATRTHRPPRRGDGPGVKSVRPEKIDHTHGEPCAARYVAPVRLECIRETNLRLQNLPPSFSFGQTSGPGRPEVRSRHAYPRDKGSAAVFYPGCSGRETKATGHHTAVERLDRRERRRTTPMLIAATSAAKHSKENPLPGPPPAAAAPGEGADGPLGGSGVFDFPGDPSDCRDPLRSAGLAEAGCASAGFADAGASQSSGGAPCSRPSMIKGIRSPGACAGGPTSGAGARLGEGSRSGLAASEPTSMGRMGCSGSTAGAGRSGSVVEPESVPASRVSFSGSTATGVLSTSGVVSDPLASTVPPSPVEEGSTTVVVGSAVNGSVELATAPEGSSVAEHGAGSQAETVSPSAQPGDASARAVAHAATNTAAIFTLSPCLPLTRLLPLRSRAMRRLFLVLL